MITPLMCSLLDIYRRFGRTYSLEDAASSFISAVSAVLFYRDLVQFFQLHSSLGRQQICKIIVCDVTGTMS